MSLGHLPTRGKPVLVSLQVHPPAKSGAVRGPRGRSGCRLARTANWHLRLPEPPKGFPEKATFHLTEAETTFIQGRIQEHCVGRRAHLTRLPKVALPRVSHTRSRAWSASVNWQAFQRLFARSGLRESENEGQGAPSLLEPGTLYAANKILY